MSDPFIGEIKLVPYNFAPLNWAFCDGSLLAISQYTALFALLGTTYGGDGQTTFALPDMRGKVPISAGQSSAGSNYTQGEVGGSSSVTLTTQQIPAHTHGVAVSDQPASQASPIGAFLAIASAPLGNVYDPPGRGTGAGVGLLFDGGGQPHENRQPFLALNYVIALEGIFPQRN